MFFLQKRAFSLGKKTLRCGHYFRRAVFRRAAMTRTLMKKTPRCGQGLTGYLNHLFIDVIIYF
jgi:hypothetical protein